MGKWPFGWEPNESFIMRTFIFIVNINLLFSHFTNMRNKPQNIVSYYNEGGYKFHYG